MKHMPGYDFVVSACWDEYEDEQPDKCVRETVKTLRRFSYPMSSRERHRSTDFGTSRNSRRRSSRMKIEVRYRRFWCGRPEGSDVLGLCHLQVVQDIVPLINEVSQMLGIAVMVGKQPRKLKL